MSWPRRPFIVGGILVALAALVVPPAFAKDYHISAARVEVEVGPDGTVEVTEHISFDFNGSFEGAYRDIPIRTGEQVLDVIVSEGATVFTPDAPTELGSSGAPSSFGVENLGSIVRVVWHYRASDEVRTFTVSYRMTGLAVAYDDVVDVYLQVWGDEWKVDLDQIEAVMRLPGSAAAGDVLVWGHPSSVQGVHRVLCGRSHPDAVRGEHSPVAICRTPRRIPAIAADVDRRRNGSHRSGPGRHPCRRGRRD